MASETILLMAHVQGVYDANLPALAYTLMMLLQYCAPS